MVLRLTLGICVIILYIILLYYYILLYIILLYYYILSYLILYSSFSFLPLPFSLFFLSSQPFYTCRVFHLLIYTLSFQAQSSHFILYLSVLTYIILYSPIRLFLLSSPHHISSILPHLTRKQGWGHISLRFCCGRRPVCNSGLKVPPTSAAAAEFT